MHPTTAISISTQQAAAKGEQQEEEGRKKCQEANKEGAASGSINTGETTRVTESHSHKLAAEASAAVGRRPISRG